MLVLVAPASWEDLLPRIREQGGIASMWGSVLDLCGRPWPQPAALPPQPWLKARAEQAFTPLFTPSARVLSLPPGCVNQS